MSVSLGSLLYTIKAKNAEFKSKMNESKQKIKEFDGQVERNKKSLQTWTGNAKKVGVVATAAFAGVVAIGVKLAKFGMDAEETGSKFNAVFKEMAQETEQWAKDFGRQYGFARTQMLGFLSTVQDTLVPMGMARDEAAGMSKDIVALAADLGSFNNLPTEQVIRDIQSTLVGNTETMRKYGVVITETRMKQFALNEGIIKEGQQLDELQKMRVRYLLMLNDTTDAQGDLARTSESAANQFRRTKNLIRDIADTLGVTLLPVVNAVLSVTNSVLSAVQGVIEKFTEQKESIEDLANEYEELKSKEKLTADEKERLKTVTDELTKAFPDAITGIDSETGAWELNTDSILENIRTRKLLDSESKIKDRIKDIERETKRIKDQNELLEKTMSPFSSLAHNINKEKAEIFKIIEEAELDFGKMFSKSFEEITLEDFIEVQNTDEFREALGIGTELQARYRESIGILKYYQTEIIDANNQTIQENKNQIIELTAETEKLQSTLNDIDAVFSGEMSLADFFKKAKEEAAKLNEEIKGPEEDPDAVKSASSKSFATMMDDYNKKLAEGYFKSYEQEIRYLDDVKKYHASTWLEKADVEEKIFNLAKANFEKKAEEEKWSLEKQLNNLDQFVKQYAISTEQIRKYEAMVANLKEQSSNEQYKTAIEAYKKEISIGEKTAEEKSKIFQETMKEYGISLAENQAALKQFEQLQIDIINERLKEESKANELEKQASKQKLDFEDSIQNQINQIILSSRELELEQATKSYKEQLKLAKKHKADEVLVKELYDVKVKSINDKYDSLEKDAELKKQKFLLQQREISYYDYLDYLEKQLEADEEHTDNWYSLMQERQNTLNTIVQNEMKHYQEQSNEMFENENERTTWLIDKLMILKDRYADNNIIVHLLNEEIKKLKNNITDPPSENALNWLENMFVDIGYSIEEAQESFKTFKDSIVDGLTDAIIEGENFLETLKNIADQIAAMVVKKGVESFVNWMLTSLFPMAHNGALVTTAGLVRDLPSYHSGGKIPGLTSNEQLIKVIPGERILSPSQNKAYEVGLMRPEVNIEVVNNTGTSIQTRKEVKFDGTRTIVRMFMEGYARNIDGIQDIIKRR